MLKRPKISIIGAGFTGASTAVFLAQKELGDIVLLDIREDYAKGIALDLLQATPVLGVDVSIKGTADYSDIADSAVVVVTAGVPRKPGMSREDLVTTNASIVRNIAEQVAKYAPDAYMLILTNPVDSMTYVAQKASGFPPNRVFGQSGVLDTARYQTFLAEALGVSVEDITGFVLGGHGDDMVPLVRYTYAGGIPVETLLDAETLAAIVERTRKGGGEIVNLMGTSAGYAPGMSLVAMVEAVIRDKKRILPAIAKLEGQYGHSGFYMGVMTLIGGGGIERIFEVELTEAEQAALDKSAAGIKQLIENLGL